MFNSESAGGVKVQMCLFCGDKRTQKNAVFKETNYSQWLAGCHLCYWWGADVHSGHQFIHGFIIFLYLHLIMGVSGNLVIGFT